MIDYGVTYSSERPQDVDTSIKGKVYVASNIEEVKDEDGVQYRYNLIEYTSEEYEAMKSGKKGAPKLTKGTRTATQYFTSLDGYMVKDAAGRSALTELAQLYGDGSFYPKADCELVDVTGVESDTMRVMPITGNDYYPYVFLASKPYPTQSGDEWTPCGKRYNGQTDEHVVAAFIVLIDPTTGEAVSGYPQQISQTTWSIVDGGYCRIKNWTISDNGSQVKVTTTRYNPTYTNPIDTTVTSSSVPTGALDGYLTKPYKVEINKDNTAYAAVSATWTDFVIQGYSTGGEALNDVVAVKIVATEAIPAGTKIVITPPQSGTPISYTLTQGLQNGDAVTWADNAITPIIAEAQWSISVDKADDTDWYAPPFTFTLFKEV